LTLKRDGEPKENVAQSKFMLDFAELRAEHTGVPNPRHCESPAERMKS
jgi:hypothetical protein